MSVPITITGNLTRDIEVGATTNGTVYGKSAVAVNNRVRDAAGNWTDGEPDYFELTMWGDTAEHAAECLSKGARVVVVGRVKHERWQATDGTNRSAHVVHVEEIGPSLRWAVVSGIEKRTGSGNGAARPQVPVPDGPPPGVWS